MLTVVLQIYPCIFQIFFYYRNIWFKTYSLYCINPNVQLLAVCTAFLSLCQYETFVWLHNRYEKIKIKILF